MASLTEHLRWALDPAAFAAECLGWTPDPWQNEVLNSTARQVIMCCSRQSGKTLTTAALALHEALFGVPGPTLLISPSLRQSQEHLQVIKQLLERVPRELAHVVRETTLSIELSSGARVLSLPGGSGPDVGRTIRGFSAPRLIVIDEAARVPEPLYAACRPMLAVSGGRIALLSTPWGKRGFFHHEWTEGGDWHRVRLTAEECPRISPMWLEQERRNRPPWEFRQEYLCEFVEPEGAAFDFDAIARAIDPELAPLFAVPGEDESAEAVWGHAPVLLS